MKVLDRTTLHQFGDVRLVGPGMNEIMPIHQAWNTAEDQGLDLVLVSDAVTPPVVKIQDHRKVDYEKKKARKAQKKAASQGVLKEIRMRVHISDHDLMIKVGRAQKFLARGDKVKIVVHLRGRERDYLAKAWQLVDRFAEQVQPCQVNKGRGPMITALIEPPKKSNKSSSSSSSPKLAEAADQPLAVTSISSSS